MRAQRRPLRDHLQDAADERADRERQDRIVAAASSSAGRRSAAAMSATLSRPGANAATAKRCFALSAAIPRAAVPMKKMYGKTRRVSVDGALELAGARVVAAGEELGQRARAERCRATVTTSERDERGAAHAREEAPRGVVAVAFASFSESTRDDGARDRALAEELPERVGDREGDPERVGRVAVEERRERHVAHQPEDARGERPGADDPRARDQAASLALARRRGCRAVTASVMGRGSGEPGAPPSAEARVALAERRRYLNE